MRVAIDMLMADKEGGGMLYAGFALLEGLARTSDGTDNDYYVITGRPDNYQVLPTSKHVHLHPVHLLTWEALLVQHQLILPQVLRRIKPDVLHVPAFVAPVGWGGPLVVTVHDLRFLQPEHQDEYSAHTRLYWKYLLHESVRRAQHIIVVSEQTREELKRHWSVEDERMTVIHDTVRPSLAPRRVTAAQKAAIQQRYGGCYLLHVGRIVPHKNVETLIAAFALLAAQDPALHLVLIGGSADDYPAVERQIAASPFRERIHDEGWVPDNDLGTYYAGASALVFPSRYEGFGLPSLEAMGFGVPVVASPEAASPEVVDSAVLYADCSNPISLADAISQVLTDTVLRDRLMTLGLQQARLFSVEGCAEATCRVYERALALATEQGVGV